MFDIELVEANMLSSHSCFSDLVSSHKPDYIIHSACPFMEGTRLDVYKDQIRGYTESSTKLAEMAMQMRAKKIVFTGAASSVVG